MSRYGEDMIRELSNFLDAETIKTAAKKDKEEKEEDKKEECEKEEKEDKKEEEKEEKEECEKEEGKEDKKEEKKDKKKSKKKKAEVMIGIVNDLVKMANELDAAGADEAAELVDSALQVILTKIEK